MPAPVVPAPEVVAVGPRRSLLSVFNVWAHAAWPKLAASRAAVNPAALRQLSNLMLLLYLQ